jgi:hypothetical protein
LGPYVKCNESSGHVPCIDVLAIARIPVVVSATDAIRIYVIALKGSVIFVTISIYLICYSIRLLQFNNGIHVMKL